MQQIISTIKNTINHNFRNSTEEEKLELANNVLRSVLLNSMMIIVDKVDEKNREMGERLHTIIKNEVGPEEVAEAYKICNILQIEVDDIVENVTGKVLEKVA